MSISYQHFGWIASQEKAGAGLRTDFGIVNELGIASVRKLNIV